MDAQLKQRWVAALRGGDYSQGMGTLFNGKHYCCLGVLCVVKGIEFSPENNPVLPDNPEWDGEYKTLFPDISRDELDRLWGKNDSGTPFAIIADYIEENL